MIDRQRLAARQREGYAKIPDFKTMFILHIVSQTKFC